MSEDQRPFRPPSSSVSSLSCCSVSRFADALSSRAGEELDAVIVSQPYHVLSSRESLTVAARNALSDEEGTLGLIWHRALPEGSKAASAFTAAVQAAAAKTGPSASGGGLLLPALEQGESPLTWVEKRLALAAGPDGKKPADSSEDGPAGSAANPFLPGCGIPFRPLKHRKFIEAFKPVSAADAAALLKHTHDTCRGAKPSAAVWEAGVASLKSLDKSGVFDADRQQNEREYREGAFSVDLHAFHTSVIPKKAKEVK